MLRAACVVLALVLGACGGEMGSVATEPAKDAAIQDVAAGAVAGDGDTLDDAQGNPGFDATGLEASVDASVEDVTPIDAPFFDAEWLDASLCPFPSPAGDRCDVAGQHLCGYGCALQCYCENGVVSCVAPPCMRRF